MNRPLAGVLMLALLWVLSVVASLHFFDLRYPFAWHMLLHMSSVALIAPLLAWLSTARIRVHVTAASALLACALEFIVVWGWHIPKLHHAAQHNVWILLLEQASFLLAGYALWMVALGRLAHSNERNGLFSAGLLLLTSMHMTLLGALLCMAPRVLYLHTVTSQYSPTAALLDQQIGGVLMLAIGGVSYLAGGLVVLGLMLQGTNSLSRDNSASSP